MTYILYGSQTGQAKSIAEDIYGKLSECNPSIHLCELDEIEKSYRVDEINYAIIICSTTGDGDAPENASRFLRKIKIYSQQLSNLKYTILGLGDTNYSNFCNCGKLIEQFLKSLGAEQFYQSGWADDAIGLELCVEPWLDGLYAIAPAICDNIPINGLKALVITETVAKAEPASLVDSNTELLGDHLAEELRDKSLSVPALPTPFLRVTYCHDDMLDSDCHEPTITMMMMPSSNSELSIGELVTIEKVTKKFAIKPVHKVSINVPNSDWKWKPGDSVGILPRNSETEVDAILSRLEVPEIDRNCSLELAIVEGTEKRRAKIPEHLVACGNGKISLKSIFMWLVDIRQPVSKVGLRIMCEYFSVSGGAEQRRLMELCSREGQGLYLKCLRETSMPLLDLLNWFPSCRVPVERLLEVLPRLKPRAYSLCDLKSVSFAFSKVDIAPIAKFRKRPLTGVCTSWIESLTQPKPGRITKIPIYLRKNMNGFSVGEDPSVPHILIGPGTGVAPFIGFLQYFEELKNAGVKIGQIWLFFGCRNEDRDFIFREELASFLEKGVLSHLCVCFSREDSVKGDGDTQGFCRPQDCKYVQHCLLFHARQLSSLLLNDGARVFVCGDMSGMAKDVLEAWPRVLMAGQNKAVQSQKDAESFITAMRVQKRYLEDVWV